MDAKTKEPLSVRLRKELENRDISVPQFADQTGLPKDRVYKWLKRGTDNIKHEDASVIEAWIANEMDNFPNQSTEMDTKKPAPEGADWKAFALEMKGLAEGWRHLSESQRTFIDQVQAISFNLNKLLSGGEASPEVAASELPAAAQELIKTGRSGSFQTAIHNEPVGSSNKKGK